MNEVKIGCSFKIQNKEVCCYNYKEMRLFFKLHIKTGQGNIASGFQLPMRTIK